MEVVSRKQPLSSIKILVGLAIAIVLLAFAGIHLSPSKSWVVFFDNLHWTVSCVAAAALAWQGVRQSTGNERETRRWFFLGLAAYALGQVLWDIQVYTGWNPFPAPADIFYLMLGLFCIVGLTHILKDKLSPANKRALGLDMAMLSMPMLALILVLYSPGSAHIGWLQQIALVAYPLIMLSAGLGIGLMALHLRPRPHWSWIVFMGAMILNTMIWMHWNYLALNNASEDGSLVNMSFSVVALVMGFAAMHWRIDSSKHHRYCEWCENILGMLPLLGVLVSGTAAILVLVGSFYLSVKIIVLTAAVSVLVIAVVRQSLLLSESERMLKMEQALRESESRENNLNQLYHAVLRSNEAMMRIADEATLTNQICRIAVEYGGMSLAWIGVLETETQRIIPMAKYGSGTDYIDGVIVSVSADIPEGRGPTGTAYRESRPVINNDYLNNPDMAPWRERVLQYGWGSSASFPILRGGNPYAVLSVHHDLTYAFDQKRLKLLQEMSDNISFALDRFDQVMAEKASSEKLALAAKVFSEAHEGITITDASGSIIDVNPMFCAITGYNREEVIGQNPRILSSGRQSPEFYNEMWTTLAEEGYWKGEVWNRKKSGELYAERLSLSALRDENGTTLHYVGLFSDITHIKHQQEALELMAHYDALTNLPNRVLFADRFNRAIARSKRENTLLALCYLDLDGFKQVNDTLGHEAGDQLLVEVAERIKSSMREEDTVSRMGGDEFAMLMGDLQSLEQCETALTRIHHAISQPYMIDGQPVKIAASTGVTLYPMDEADPDTLIRHADQAMYQAKSEGRNRYHLFDASHDQEVQSQRQQLNAIEDAFTRNEFCLYYQPKVDMTTGEVVGAEALIRWKHPERGLIPPIEFLPVIEGTSFEIVVGNWVMDQALRQMQIWKAEGLVLQVSINISPLHLQWAYFFNQLEATLAMYQDVSSSLLQLEVLESSVLGDLATIGNVIQSCRDALGVSIALDDFGTGYSSLTHLRHLPANTIKVDQSFVRNMIDDPDDYAIVEGVIGLSGAFRREVIAEGVETRDHGLMLLILGCTLAQGYGIARPMPAETMVEWVKNYRPDAKWLDTVSNPLTPGAAQVLLMMIESHQWVRRLEACLNAKPDAVANWPIMSHMKCHSGRWIMRAEKHQLFEPVLIERLNLAHVELHQIGNHLMHLYHEGKVDDARAGIKEVHSVQQLIEGILNSLV